MISYLFFMKHKDRWYYYVLILIIILALIVRIYFIDFNYEIPGSDEGEYLVMAESFKGGEIISQWPYYRPFLLPFIWGLLGKLGFGLTTYRITLILFSLASVLLVYLIGKDLFNPKVGLTVAFFMVFYPDEITHSLRILINGVALTMWLLSIYFFQKAYFNKSTRCLYISAIVTGLAILIYSQNIALLAFHFLFLLIADGPQFFKNLKYIYFFLISILIYSVNFLYSYIWFGDPLKNFGYGLWLSYIDTHSRSYLDLILDFIKYMPNYFSWFYIPILTFSILLLFYYVTKIFLLLKGYKFNYKQVLTVIFFLVIFFIIQYYLSSQYPATSKLKVMFYLISSFTTIFFGFIFIYLFRDFFYMISQNSEEKLKKHILLLCWIFVGFFVISNMVGKFQARYFLPAIIPLFFYMALLINLVYNKSFKNFNFKMLFFLILLLIFLGVISNLNFTSKLINSYPEVGNRDLGIWLNENTEHDDFIFGSVDNALVYYSGARWYRYPISNIEGGNYTVFLSKFYELRPKFLVLYKFRDGVINSFYVQFINNNNPELIYLHENYHNESILVYSLNYSNSFS